MQNVCAVILAAGMGKRMRSSHNKVIHKICGKALINWVLECCTDSDIKDMAVIVGQGKEEVMSEVKHNVTFLEQKEQLGTGHAVMTAAEFIKNSKGDTIVLYADVPLLTSETIKELIEKHIESNSDATILTAFADDPTGYGRIIRNESGSILKIVEHRDTNEAQKQIKEYNSGIIIFKSSCLIELLQTLKNDNDQKEYYLTDTIEEIVKKGLKLNSYTIYDQKQIIGINDREQLAEAAKIAKDRIIKSHMANGVTFEDPYNIYIEADVKIEQDVTILSGCRLEGKTSISTEALIGPGSRIIDSSIGKGTTVNNSIIIESCIGENTKIGPFAYIRPGSSIGNDVRVGDFVEIKKSKIGNRSKVAHLAYVGDAIIGENCNIGCGVVFVNYDGRNKNQTIVGDNAFIGSNVNLISPLEIESDAYIAAGSTITDKVTSGSLAIARSRQTNKEGWVASKSMFRK